MRRRSQHPPQSRSLALAIVALLAATIAWPASASAQDEAPDATAIATIVEAAQEDLDIPGISYVVVANGETIALGAAGVIDRTTNQPVDPGETSFRIGSVSKPVTATVLLQLVAEGSVELDDTIDEYVDLDPGRSFAVTVGSLLTHTSGFESNSIGLVARDADSVDPLSDYVQDGLPTRFEETGVVHSYSNYGYGLAGHIIETVAGTDFAPHVDAALFAPLGMTSSSFGFELPGSLATGYDGLAGSRSKAEEVYLRPYPAGGAFTTAADMAELLDAMLGHHPDVVAPEVADQLITTGFRSHPDVPGRTIGGLEEMNVNGVRVVGHSGDIAGFGAQLALVPDHDIGIFFAANAVDFELNDRLVDEIVGHLVEPEPQPDPTFAPMSSEELDEFAGSYRWTRYSRSKVDKILAIFPTHNFTVRSPGDGTLVVEIGGVDQTWTYEPIDDLAFAQTAGDKAIVDGLVIDPGERISFTRDSDGDIAYLNFAMSTIAGERTPGYLMGPTQMLLGAILIGLFLLSLPVWGITALRRRRRDDQLTNDERWIRRGVIAHSAAVVIAMAATIVGLLGPVPFGLPPAAVLGLALITIAATVGLALLPTAAIAWHQGMLSLTERLTITTLAVATPILLWWLNYWNLFGFHF